MEGPNPNKGQTPKKGFSVPKNPSSGVKESNENECNKLQNPKKPVPKNFMSPTISAASKVSTPRKKILGERNGIPLSSDPHSLKSPSLLPRTDRSGQFSPNMISSYSCAADSDDEEKSSASAVAAYDPASSYLSPRPKYLRYNPNRKREVLLQLESMGGNEGDEFGVEERDFQNVEEEVEEEFEEESDVQNVEEEVEKSEIIQSLDVNKTDVVDSENCISQDVVKMDNCEEEVEENDDEEVEDDNRSDVIDSEKVTSQVTRSDVFDPVKVTSQGVVKMPEDEVEENDDGEVDDLNAETAEECEEVHGWSLRRILKFLVVLSIFVLATSFSLSIHSTVLNSDSEGITLIKDQTGYGLTHDFRVGNHSLGDESEPRSPGHLFDMVKSEITNFQNSEPDMLEEATLRELTDSHGRQSEVDMEFYYGIEEAAERTAELLVEADMVEFEVDDIFEDATKGELTDSLVKQSEVEIDMYTYGNEESEAQTPELSVEADMVESEVDNMLEEATEGELTEVDRDCYGNEESEAQTPELLAEVDMVGSEGYTMSEEATEGELTEVDRDSYGNEESEAQTPELLAEADMVEDAPEGEFTDSHANEPNDEPILFRNNDHMVEEESINTMAAENTKLKKPMNRLTRIILLVVLGAMVIILSGYWVLLLCSNGRQAAQVSPMSIEKLDSTDEPCPGTPKAEERKEKLAQPCAASSVFDFSEQAAKEFSQMRSPTVKLLGEMVVREVERSLWRCDQKVGDELIESEESSNFIERKKKKAMFSNLPPALDYSIADSASCYGSFTTEARILKKENGKDAEITTPVRRSNRLRSRSVTLSHES